MSQGSSGSGADGWQPSPRTTQAVVRFGVFGTPTLVLDEGEVVFVKLASTPQAGQELDLWESLRTVAQCFPELVEIKRPLALAATPGAERA